MAQVIKNRMAGALLTVSLKPCSGIYRKFVLLVCYNLFISINLSIYIFQLMDLIKFIVNKAPVGTTETLIILRLRWINLPGVVSTLV